MLRATSSARCAAGSTAVTRARCRASAAAARLAAWAAHRSSQRPVSASTGANVSARATS
ncbi:hypothetical protein I553_3678 [Mycobacterium xenopi 4042]|uniref:Uncharacterized protein n=1 Tax=Mycobacterium xenopi 4042 TaxID=1299334 RepID=X7ZIH2_MYCXE|nr:hypothetical protein I553_3678 [Mycobacterium xenopi 4042]